MSIEELSHIKGLIIDMDGVLWQDTVPIGDLEAIFNRICDLDLRVILATNNATRTVEGFLEKLAGFDVHLLDEQVINTAQAAGIYLQDNYTAGTKVYVVGQPSLKQTLENFGMVVCDDTNNDIKVVVASLDYKLTYEKLKKASLLLQSGCDFIGTNQDRTLPTPEGFIPGSGAVIGALEIASGRKAKIIGKPEPFLYEMALKRLGLSPTETLAVGDRLETDIAGAQAAGIHTALVLTGASTLEQAYAFNPQPDIVIQDFTELVFQWKR